MEGKTMNEEMNRIKDYFKGHRCVFLAKQCKQEYIVYSYFLNYDGTAIVRLNKQHFKNRDLENGKSKSQNTSCNSKNHIINRTTIK